MLDPLKDELRQMLDDISTEYSDPGREVRAATARAHRRQRMLQTRPVGLRLPAPPSTEFGDGRDRALQALKHLLEDLPWTEEEALSEASWKACLVGFLCLRAGRSVAALEAWRRAGAVVPIDRTAPETLCWLLERELRGQFPPGTTLKHARWGEDPDRWGAVIACAGDGPSEAVAMGEFSRYEHSPVMRLVYLDTALQWPLDRLTEAICRLDRAVILAAEGLLDQAAMAIAPRTVEPLAPYGAWAWPLLRAWIERERAGESGASGRVGW